MTRRKLGLLLGVVFVMAVVVSSAASAARGTATSKPQVISDADLKAQTTTIGGGANPLPTTRTVPHWWGSTLDPNNGVTYGYNMVGADPNACSGSACSVTVETDITPLIVNVGGLTFSGNDVLGATLASPQFGLNDYGSTPFATAGAANLPRGPGGLLSQNDAGTALQLQDATMRAQFNKTGTSNYHLKLHPNVLPPVTLNVPQNQGVLLQSGRGVIFADINISWWAAQIQNLETKADPTHLPLYLTDNVLLHIGQDVFNCCVIGFHGTRATGLGGGSGGSNGNTKVQTFAWASWVQPGIYARPNGGTDWALQDIHALSHEIAEWADAVADADGAAVRLHRHSRDRRPSRGNRLREGCEHLRAGPEPGRLDERRWVLPPGGRGLPAVVHEDHAQQRVRTDAESLGEHRALHVDG